MAQISKREFDVLDVTGQRYPQWKDDIIAHLGAMGLEHTIEEGGWATHQEKQMAHIFIRHHMNESLKNEYIRVRDPYDLLNHLEARFGHHHDLEYCGDEVTDFAKLEKTFSTMGAPNLQYARQLRWDKFTKFTDLIAVLLLSEQHDKILLKNDNMRPSGSAAIPEANAIAKFSHGRWNNRRGRGRGRGHALDRKNNSFCNTPYFRPSYFINLTCRKY
ncbi:hypothetical protein RND81_10G105100 [Saponaria officinalis]|uniref:Uncharacterized protein n=1 Tax=Saponaria officinalis TaxID=3572 RepID=A0AAW1I2Y3_SAPOF